MAHALVEDYGIKPGNRILIRSANNPAMVACWLAATKAGAVVVNTIEPLIYLAEKGQGIACLPDFAIRELGKGAPFAQVCNMLNSLMILVLVPICGALSGRFSASVARSASPSLPQA